MLGLHRLPSRRLIATLPDILQVLYCSCCGCQGLVPSEIRSHQRYTRHYYVQVYIRALHYLGSGLLREGIVLVDFL
nr:MAG TPA: Transmembrane and coiled-coil domain-containing protein 2 [Caudoviricetes sp.]